MPYYRPIKTIASVAGLPGGSGGAGGIVIVSTTEPQKRDDGSALRDGDFWFDPDSEFTYIYVQSQWEVIGSNVDYSGDFIIDGGNSLGNGFIDNNPGDGTGGAPTGDFDTSDLKLAFVNNTFSNLRITDLPPTDGINFQSDANEWFLSAILSIFGDVDILEKEVDNLNNVGANIEFKSNAPITVEVVGQKVRHGFDMNTLTSIR